MAAIRICALLSVFAIAALAQSSSGQATFEVALMKPTASGGSGRMNCQGGPGTADPGRFTCTNAPLGMLLSIGYDVQAYQERGPDWMMTGGYDIVAKVPAGATRPQMKAMIQNLLAERLRLKLHREMRDTRSYSLTVKKGGPSVKPSPPTEPGEKANRQMLTSNPDGHWRLTATREPMATLAGYLSVQLRNAVSDNTGLAGDYDFILDYWPPQYSGANPDLVPEIPAALQDQPGLKLEFKMQPTEFLVVDSASKTPTDN